MIIKVQAVSHSYIFHHLPETSHCTREERLALWMNYQKTDKRRDRIMPKLVQDVSSTCHPYYNIKIHHCIKDNRYYIMIQCYPGILHPYYWYQPYHLFETCHTVTASQQTLHY